LVKLEERAKHRAELITYFEKYSDLLDDDARRRLHSNPLRILDSKNPAMQEMIAGAPKLMEHLGSESMAHFEGVQQVLRDAGLPFEINPRLVRGLDYYNLTVFEWVTDRLGAQGTVCAGGRYDGLVEQLGGKATPACGFAMGVERLVTLVRESGGEPAFQGLMSMSCIKAKPLRAWRHALPKACAIRGWTFSFTAEGGVQVADEEGRRFRRNFAVIIGDDEANAGEVTLKPLRSNGETQERTETCQRRPGC
jgi:histidyl-tRNA synthetase